MGATRREVETSGDLVMAPRVPHGLAAAVEGLTREVIRHRPEDIYDFAAQHFEQLLHLRDQYGAVTNLPGRSGNTAALREMNRSLKQRYANGDDERVRSEEMNERRRVGGWSLNETAKVMERHRSIFGDEGRRMSPEDVRALANEKENKSSSGKSRTGRRTKSRSDLDSLESRQNSSERYAKRSKEREQKSKGDSGGMKIDSDGAPILMTRIGAIAGTGCMLAKDIKSELRKNRNGSRDGRGKTSGRERNELKLGGTRLGIVRRDDSARRSDAAGSKWNRSADRSETDNQKYKTETDEATARSVARIPRALSMDRVRDSVVKKFHASESWDEGLVSTSYVDKVQEVIDETAPTIREKVRELSKVVAASSAGRRSRQDGYRSVDESTSTSEKSNQTDDVRSRSGISRSKRSRKSSVRNKSKTSVVESRANDSLEGIETLASEVEVRAAMMVDGKDEIRELSATRREKERSRPRLGKKNGRVSGDSDVSDYSDVPKKLSGASSLSLPAVRPLSSRNTSRSVSRSDSDNLILPPISPETPKPARQKETLVLPCLPPSTIGTSPVDLPSARTTDHLENRTRVSEIGETEDPALFEDAEEPKLNLPDAPTDEIFKDSLNATPEIFDVPPRPDSLEPVVTIGEVEKSERSVTDLSDESREIGKEENEEARETEENNTVRGKLMEIEETEKRIEQIFRCDEVAPPMERSKEIEEDSGSMRRKLMEIEAVEKRIESVFGSAGIKEPRDEFETVIGGERNVEIAKGDRQVESTDLGSSVPGIFVDEVRPAGENSTMSRSAGSFSARKSVTPELASDVRELDVENGRQSTVRSEDELRFEEVSSRTSDSLQNSYILTEGSPLDIPDSVTTVIIAERQDSLESGAEKIIVESRASDDNTEISGGFDESKPNSADKLVEVLENVEKSAASTANERVADFPGESKELVSGRQDDLGQIGKELADPGHGELEKPRVASVEAANVTIEEEEEKNVDPLRKNVEADKDEKIGIREAKITAAIVSERTQALDSILGEETKIEESSVREENPGATTMADRSIGVLEKYVATDSPSTGSTDEVKETTISDDGGISGAESSVTSQFCEDDTDPRNSESSNEVKETTISDRPAEDAGQQNLYNLAPRCYGSMPHVPELNLDSLQDITVSSFQLSDDAATKEDSATSQESGENATSFTEMIEDVAVATRDEASVVEEIITKEQVPIREDPCVKITTYVTEPDTDVNPIEETANPTINVVEEAETPISAESATKQLPESNRSETDSLRDFEDLENRVSKTEAGDLQKIETADSAPEANVTIISGYVDANNGSSLDPATETSRPSDKILKTVVCSAEKSQGSAPELPENTDLVLLSASGGDDSKSLVARSVVPTEIDITTAFGDIVVAESIEPDADDKNPLFDVEKNVDSNLPSHPIDSSVLLVSETPIEAETILPTANLHARSSQSSVSEIIDSVLSTDKNNSSSAFPEAVVPAEGVEKSTSAPSVTTESRALPEDPNFGLSSATSGGTNSIEPPDTKETLVPRILETPEASAPRELDEHTERIVVSESPLSETLQPEGDKTIVVSEEAVFIESPDDDESTTAVVLEASDPSVPCTTDVPEDSTVPLIVSPDKLDRSVPKSLEDARLIVPPENEDNSRSADSAHSRVILPSSDDCNVSVVNPAADNETRPESTTATKNNESATPSSSEVVPTPIVREPENVVDEHVDPPRAEVVTNDLDGERLEYHIYVPEVTGSEESSTTESSTFNSAATKIQAGVRGFLTRRRLQSAQRRSSTLDSVPSIQDSFATDATHLEPIEELGLGQAATTIQSNYRGYKARQRLRREDAVQKTTLSVENAFLENGLQHTGEFHDCLPLPTLEIASARIEDASPHTSAGPGAGVENDAASRFRHSSLSSRSESEEIGSDALDSTNFTEKGTTDVDVDENRVVTRTGKYSLSTDATGNAWTDTAETHSNLRGLNLVIAIGGSNALQNQYLNFITSVEEAQDETATAYLQGDLQDLRSSLPSSNVGVDSLSMDKANDVSWGSASIREPLAIPGTPTGVVIEELSRTDAAATDSSITDTTSAILTTDEASGLNSTENGDSSCEEKSLMNMSLSLPGLSLEPEIEANVVVSKPVDDASLDTAVFSTNVDDALGVGGENEPSTKIKPILEVTVTPRDLLKLTNRSQGSQLSGERVESPVTMMQIVPKSVDDERPGDVEVDSNEVAEKREEVAGGREESTTDAKSSDSRIESERRDVVGVRADDSAKNEVLPADEEPKDESEVKLARSSTEESTSERLSKTYSLEK